MILSDKYDYQTDSGLLHVIEAQLLNGNLQFALDNKENINSYIQEIIYKDNLSENEVKILGQLIHIGNLVYNNSDLDDNMQPIENGIYDLLLEKYRKYNPNFQVGAEPVQFNDISKNTSSIDSVPMVRFLDDSKVDNMIFSEFLFNNPPITKEDLIEPMVSFGYETSKKYREVSHSNPELVGTLDKCKYVLNAQAIEKGVFDDPKVRILERDFFGEHFRRGIINNNTNFRMIAELKYDGTSVVVSIVNGMVVKAESRGDTGMGKATDLTPILYGYRFPHLPKNVAIDVKCEAIMTYRNLYLYNQERGKTYKNCRSAINGLFGSNDGYLYQKYITLIPLKIAPSSIVESEQWNEPIDRLTEIEFMNKFLRTGEILRYAYLEGDYTTVLFLIKKFVEEAEFAREIMPVMYDGVVLSYIDDDIIKALGRENFVNKYQVAIKFNSLKKMTTFRGYTFTVGQNGNITPMAHYDPVEFLGTIHTKSSISSYDRFMNLGLKIGDIIEVEYINDVMPYVTKPDLDVNLDNLNPVEEFPSNCPSCNSPLFLSESGKTAACTNLNCPERTVQRMANMMDKLGLKDFAEASMEKINATNLTQLMSLSRDYLIPILGEVNSYKFIERINSLRKESIYDYIIVGALGFTSIAQDTWKKIFNVYSLQELIAMKEEQLYENLTSIKGIGPTTALTIIKEMPYFIEDMLTIAAMPNIVSSKGLTQKKIRCTGFRDPELMKHLRDMGYDADDNKAVTKDTYILLVPQEGHVSTKTKSAGPNTKIIPVAEFKANMDKYL